MKKTHTLVTALCLLFSSCYFDSAGNLPGKVGYAATANSSNARGGNTSSELMEYKDFGIGGVYKVKAEADNQANRIIDVFKGRFPRYFTAAEAAYLRECVRAYRIEAASRAALGNKLRDMNSPETSAMCYEIARGSQRLADEIESLLNTTPIR